MPVSKLSIKMPWFCFALGALVACFPLHVRAQIAASAWSSPLQLIDNVANNGSPTIISFQNQTVMYYVNHNDNIIYADFGFSGKPQSTGLAFATVGFSGPVDVGATVIDNGQKVLLSYVGQTQGPPYITFQGFAISSNGVNSWTLSQATNSELGLGNQGPDISFVPALTSDGTTAYVATVGANEQVYLSYTTDGITFTPLDGNGVSISSCQTQSRPALVMYDGLTVGFTSSCLGGTRQDVIINPSLSIGTTGASWGYKNVSGKYAGITLFTANNYLFVAGQDTPSSQYLKYFEGNFINGNGLWSGPYEPGNQMRWTPSSLFYNECSNYVYLVYQDAANTNISFIWAPGQ